ncbi:MAG: hypothetical protein RIB63_06900, partial [Fulvivirga sp.]
MAELHNVVGAILRDIAQARVTSDLYSREVSRYYEEDSLLRLFPIPRTEIKEVEVDLCFGIKDVRKDINREQDKLVYIARIIERYGEKLVDGIFESLKGTYRHKISKSVAWQTLVGELDTLDNRSNLRFSISNFFESNQSILLSENKDGSAEDTDAVRYDLNINNALNGVVEIAKRTILQSEEVITLVKAEDLEDSYESALRTGLDDILIAMDNDLNFEVEAYMLDVTVEAEELLELPENVLSKIKITAEIKNYTWSQVEEK